MENLFGIPMQTIMYVMVVLLAICFLSIAFIAMRRPVIFKLGIRNVPRRKTQTMLIIIGLMLATLIISAALATGDTLNYSMRKSAMDQLGLVDAYVTTSENTDFLPNLSPDQQSTITQAINDSGLADATSPMLVLQSPAVNLGDLDPTSITSPASVMEDAIASEPMTYLVGQDQATVSSFGDHVTADGEVRSLDDLKEGEVFINATLADQLDIQAGQTLFYAVNNQPHFATIAGVLDNTMINGTIMQGTGAILLPLDRLQTEAGVDGAVSLVAVSWQGDAENGLKVDDESSSTLEDSLDEYSVVSIKADIVEAAELAGNVFSTMFIVFGMFSIGVGILLIILIFTMLAAERRAEMGMERAVGAQRSQLIEQFTAEGAGYTLLSGLVGTGLGVLLTLLIISVFRGVLGDVFDVAFYVTPRSLVIAYALGVVITFLAVVLSSWRVSKLNVVSAIRDIPTVYRAKHNRRQLIWSVLIVVVGVALTWLGFANSNGSALWSGLTMFFLAGASLAAFFGISSRIAYSIGAILTLIIWLLPMDISNKIFGEMGGGMELFFLSGIGVVAAATLLIIENMDLLLQIVARAGGGLRRWLPSMRLAVAYPGASKSRSGMAIAMFALIVFSIVVMATVNRNVETLFTGDAFMAGMHVEVDVPPTNPIDNLDTAITDAGVDPALIAGSGSLAFVGQDLSEINDATGYKPMPVMQADAGFLDSALLTFQARADGYDSDQAVVDALQNEPNTVVIPAIWVTQGAIVGGPGMARIDDVPAEGSFAPVMVDFRSADGTVSTLKIVGVTSSDIAMIMNPIIGPATSQALPHATDPRFTQYFLRLTDSSQASDVAAAMEKSLIMQGAQGTDLKQMMDDAVSQQRVFMNLLQGFMGLGMVVGVAAIGVISLRAVVERRQQIGVLRSIGFQRTDVARAFVLESAFIVVLGVLAGAVFGLITGYNVAGSDELTSGGSVIIPWSTVGITVVIAIVAALLMTWLPAIQASKTAPAEALRYE